MMIQWCFVINFKIYTRTTLKYFPMQRLLQKKKKKIRQQEEKVNWERGKGKGNLKVKLKWERNIESEKWK